MCMETINFVYNLAFCIKAANSLTSTVPQSHASPFSWIPLPHTGSVTVEAGSLPKHLPSCPPTFVCSVSKLQVLQEVGGGSLSDSAMIHVESGHVQGAEGKKHMYMQMYTTCTCIHCTWSILSCPGLAEISWIMYTCIFIYRVLLTLGGMQNEGYGTWLVCLCVFPCFL